MSSTSSVAPAPYYSIYSATKNYNNVLGRSINLEYRKYVDVLVLFPAYISTPLTKNAPSNFFIIKTEEFVDSAFRQLGKITYTQGCWKHIFVSYFLDFLPNFLLDWITILTGKYTSSY